MTDSLLGRGLVCILGLPGAGKTTTARYVAIKLRERGYIPVIVSTSPLSDIDFRDEEGKVHRIVQVPIPVGSLIDENRGRLIAAAILRTANLVRDEAEKTRDWRKVFRKIRDKLGLMRAKIDRRTARYLRTAGVVVDVIVSKLLGVGLISLAESIGRIWLVEELKANERLVVIIDDLAELSMPDKVALISLIDMLRRCGAKALIIRRISLEEEFIKFAENIAGGFKARYANELLAGSREARLIESDEQVYPMLATDLETFEEILEANGMRGHQQLYQLSGGLPTLAMLMYMTGITYRDAAQASLTYYSIDHVKLKKGDPVERAKSTLNTIIAGIRMIYDRLTDNYPGILPILLQPISKDEFEEFHDGRIPRRIGPSWLIKREREEFMKETVEIYDVKELWIHLRLFIETLSNEDKEVKPEVMEARIKLLKILSEKAMKPGRYTVRMLHSALKHLHILREWGVEDQKFIKRYIWWHAAALKALPVLGIAEARKPGWVLKMIEKGRCELDPNTLNYLDELAQRCMEIRRERARDLLLRIWRVLGHGTGRRAAEALRLMAKSSTLRSMAWHNLTPAEEETLKDRETEDAVGRLIKCFGGLRGEAGRLGGTLGSYVEIWITLHELDVRLGFWWTIKEKEDIERLEDIMEQLEALQKGFEEIWRREGGELKEFLKLLPHDETQQKEIIKENFRALESFAHCLRGQLLMDLGKLEEAEGEFLEIAEIREELGDREGWLVARSRALRVRMIRVGDVDLNQLYRDFRKHEHRCGPETRAGICGEYLVWFVTKAEEGLGDRREIEHILDDIKLDPTAWALTLGLLAAHNREEVTGVGKGEVIRSLENYDAMALNSVEKGLGDRWIGVLKAAEEEGRTPPLKLLLLTTSSIHAFARILHLYLKGWVPEAMALAAHKAEEANYSPLTRRLYGELAEALKRNDQEAIKQTLTKLYYYHV